MVSKKTTKTVANGDKAFWVKLGIDFGATKQLAKDTNAKIDKFISNDFLHMNEKVDSIDNKVNKVVTKVAVIFAVGTALIIIANILVRIFV